MSFEVKASLGKNLFWDIEEIVFEIASIFDKTVSFSDVLEVIRDEKQIFLLSFQEIIDKIDMLNKSRRKNDC